jgi:uncharacterized protein (DUF4415 family)
MMAKVQISIRVDADDLEALEQLGRGAKPVPANRNEMVGAALREYVERHGDASVLAGGATPAAKAPKGKRK